MGAGTEKGMFGFGYGHKIMTEVEVLSKKSNEISHYDQTDRLQ